MTEVDNMTRYSSYNMSLKVKFSYKHGLIKHFNVVNQGLITFVDCNLGFNIGLAYIGTDSMDVPSKLEQEIGQNIKSESLSIIQSQKVHSQGQK